MSRKHFEAAAEYIRGMYRVAAGLPGNAGEHLKARAEGAEDSWVNIASQFNPRFDSVRFRQACRP